MTGTATAEPLTEPVDGLPEDEDVVEGWHWTIREDSHGELFFNGEIPDDRRILDWTRHPSDKLRRTMKKRRAEQEGERLC